MSVRLKIIIALSLLSGLAEAKRPEFVIEIKDHLFYPAQLNVPSGMKFKLIIINHDQTAEEFDSFELNREKVIFGGQSATIYVGPLRPGRYGFFGEFNPTTATGEIIATKNFKGVSRAD
jgi:hypothetical protein